MAPLGAFTAAPWTQQHPKQPTVLHSGFPNTPSPHQELKFVMTRNKKHVRHSSAQ